MRRFLIVALLTSGAGRVAADPAPSAPPAPPPERVLALSAQLFARADHTRAGGQSGFGFAIDRAELGAAPTWRNAEAELRLEALRATAADDEPFAVGLKRAWGGAHVPLGCDCFRLAARLGLVADPWIESIEAAYPLRAIAATSAERLGWIDPSDLGAAARFVWTDYVDLHVAVTSGEGHRHSDRNGEQDVAAALTLRAAVFPLLGGDASVRLHGFVRTGTLGPTGARNHRLCTAVTLASDRLSLGAEVVHAFGYADHADRTGVAVAGWASAAVTSWLGPLARIDRVAAGADRDDVGLAITGGVWARLAGGVTAYAIAERVTYGVDAVPLGAGPAENGWRASAVIAVDAGADLR